MLDIGCSEVLRQQVRAFNLPEGVEEWQPKLQHWAGLSGVFGLEKRCSE